MRHALGPAQIFLYENDAGVHCGQLRGCQKSPRLFFVSSATVAAYPGLQHCRRR